MTVTGENAAEYAKRDIVTLFNNQVPAVQAFAHRGASDLSAATLGAENARTAAGKFAQKTGQAAEGVFNQAARSVEEVVQSARGTGAMKALGVGAAVAVGAGILFGSLRSPRKGQAFRLLPGIASARKRRSAWMAMFQESPSRGYGTCQPAA